MKPLDLERLHELQLALAVEVKRICEKENIPYFLVDGTALGAINLNDFIPWDDDLDIGMYMPDYQKFLRVCEIELNPRYKMKDFTTDPHFGCSFGQLIDTTVKLVNKNNEESLDTKGVFIDIHPFCNCSEIKAIRLYDYYKFKFYKLCLLQKRKYLDKESKVAPLVKMSCRFISEETVKNRILRMRNKKRGRKALKIHGRHPEDYIQISNLRCLKTVRFAGEEFTIQPNAEQMLKSTYGKFIADRNEYNRHHIIFFDP